MNRNLKEVKKNYNKTHKKMIQNIAKDIKSYN